MKIIYVADIDQDIDDMIAIEHLHLSGYLEAVVLDRSETIDSVRVKDLMKMGVKFYECIPSNTKYIFCGGSLTKVAKYVKNNKLDLLVCNGGFVGSNIVPDDIALSKFKDKEYVRTFNFNLDIESAKSTLESNNISNVLLVSKNVCHDSRNTIDNIHQDEYLNKYNLSKRKRLHDLLMVKEGIRLLQGQDMHCEYIQVECVHKLSKPYDNSNDVFDMWGSIESKHSNVKISCKYRLNTKDKL